MTLLRKPWVRVLYLYLFCFVGLSVVVVGSVRLVDLGLKVWVFRGADRYYFVKPRPVEETGTAAVDDRELDKQQEIESIRQRQREFSGAVSMVIIGLPLYLYHWALIRRENH